ncbi:hypothetical protein OG439_40365 [Amycolatopsis sp. NBC_01307]|nr:hypothetical protein OG439_40365 [Amycolatopsis sp. NBC_01307]
MSNTANLTFYPLWLTLVGCLALAAPAAGALALVLGLIALLKTRAPRGAR